MVRSDNEAHIEVVSQLYVSSKTHGKYNQCQTFNTQGDAWYVGPHALERLSFQAIMDAFGGLLVGLVQQCITRPTSSSGQAPGRFRKVISTSIISTVLMQPDELLYLSNDHSWR